MLVPSLAQSAPDWFNIYSFWSYWKWCPSAELFIVCHSKNQYICIRGKSFQSCIFTPAWCLNWETDHECVALASWFEGIHYILTHSQSKSVKCTISHVNLYLFLGSNQNPSYQCRSQYIWTSSLVLNTFIVVVTVTFSPANVIILLQTSLAVLNIITVFSISLVTFYIREELTISSWHASGE